LLLNKIFRRHCGRGASGTIAVAVPMTDIRLPKGANMRDVFDACKKAGLPSLAQGMIEYPPPDKLRKLAAETVMQEDVHTYRTRMGEDDFKAGITKMVKRAYNEVISPAEVLAVPGVAGGVSAALLHLRKLNPSAVVAVLEPYYTFHTSEVERAFHRPPITIPSSGSDAMPNLEELKRLVEAGEVQGVIVTNPHNPSGYVFKQDEVDMLAKLSESHGLFVIFDECYVGMVFQEEFTTGLSRGTMKNVVVCRGFSKSIGAQSWRVGYAVSTPETIQGMMVMMDPLYICVNWTQHAIAKYFANHVDDFVEHNKALNELLQGNWVILRDAFAKRFGWEPLEPKGTMYGMFRHHEATDVKACEMALQAGVGICPGNIFYGDQSNVYDHTGWVRIHYGVSREKAEAIAAKLLSGVPA